MASSQLSDNPPLPRRGQRLVFALGTVAVVALAGTLGFMIVEHMRLLDALYLTLGIMSTAGGFDRPLSAGGRILAVAVLIAGLAALFYTLGTFMEYVFEGHFVKAIWRRRMDRRIERLHQHAIVCGFGRVGQQIAREFQSAGQPFVVIDLGEQNATLLHDLGYVFVQGDATVDETLLEAGLAHARMLLAATDQDTENIAITLSARALASHVWIVARANHAQTEAKLLRAGADRVLSPYRLGGHRMAELARRPQLVEFLDTALEGGEFDLELIKVEAGSPWIGKPLPAIDGGELPQELRGCAILAVCPAGQSLCIPASHRQGVPIEAGDCLIVHGPSALVRSLPGAGQAPLG
jgi:voltage-gated potassium channel